MPEKNTRQEQRHPISPSMNFWQRHPCLVPCGISIILLLIGLLRMPYDFYNYLRWVIFGTGSYIAFLSHQSKHPWALWPFVVTVLLFNPIAPFHLNWELWHVIDVVAAVLFLVGGLTVTRNTDLI